jgi:glycosyltransferase involved in cell wall biosynthesis
MSAQGVLVLGGTDGSLLNFRGSLLRALVQAGANVIAAAPGDTPGVAQRLASMGVRFEPIALARAGLNPIADGLSFVRLIRLFRRTRPDVVLSYTIKPVIYGSLAAKWVGVRSVYALITGLGAAFHTGGFRGRVLRLVAVTLYRIALKRCTKVFVQNKDIAELFIREGIVSAGKLVVVPGSGVNTQHFDFVQTPLGPPVFLLLARMLHDKGINEFVAAARLVKERLPEARFLLVGDTDPNPAAISREQLRQWSEEGVIEFQSAVSDVRPLLRSCTVYALPSYHEGLPRSVLEAMAVGRPIITTDTIGCRETIFEAASDIEIGPEIKRGLNGFLVPVRSVTPLAAVMLFLANDPALVAVMGRQSRSIAVKEFDVHRVNKLMLKTMNLTSVSSEVPQRCSF